MCQIWMIRPEQFLKAASWFNEKLPIESQRYSCGIYQACQPISKASVTKSMLMEHEVYVAMTWIVLSFVEFLNKRILLSCTSVREWFQKGRLENFGSVRWPGEICCQTEKTEKLSHLVSWQRIQCNCCRVVNVLLRLVSSLLRNFWEIVTLWVRIRLLNNCTCVFRTVRCAARRYIVKNNSYFKKKKRY